MPLVHTYDDSSDVIPLCILTGSGDISATAEAQNSFLARLNGTSSIIAIATVEYASAATIEGHSAIIARGRLNGEANILGAAILEGNSAIVPGGLLKVRAKAVLRGESSIQSEGRSAEVETSTLRVTLTIISESLGGFSEVISARLRADDVDVPIRSAVYSEPKDSPGVSLECVLQKTEDRETIFAAESFSFDIYYKDAWRTMFTSGPRQGGNFAFAWVDSRANDSLSISTIGPVSAKINRSPLEGLTIYDPLKETLNFRSFKPIWDTRGTLHFREIWPIGGLTLYQLLDHVLITRCGFTGYKTDLPDYRIRRADFETTGTFLEGLSPHVGIFDPLVFVIDDVVWILDSTESIPEGWAAPFELAADKYKNAQLSERVLNADGYVVTYTDAAEFDYQTERDEDDDTEVLGVLGDANYQEIDRSRTFRDYFKFTDPFVPVKTEKVKETEEVRAIVVGTLLTVSTTIETINLDYYGRLQSIRKETNGLIPDISAPGFPFSSTLIYRERTDFHYQPDALNFGRQILEKTVKTADGLIVIDTENEHLGRPFKQAYVDGFRAGNLNEDQFLIFGPIRTTIETVKQNDRAQLEIRLRTTDFLTTPPSITNQTTDARAGDLSTNAYSGAPQTILVFKNELTGRTNGKMIAISIGELPISLGIDLVRRKLENDAERSGSVNLHGLNLDLGRGFVFELFDRGTNTVPNEHLEPQTVGSYIIEGRQISFNDLGTPEQNTTQTIDVRRIIDEREP